MDRVTIEYSGIVYQGFTREEALQKGVPSEVVDAAFHAQKKAGIIDKRRAAYVAESDPLNMEWQFDKNPEKEAAWREKVAEIKARYPLPEFA